MTIVPPPAPTPPNPVLNALRTAVQVLVSCAVAFGVAHLALIVGHLSSFELADIYVPLTGLYFAGVSELEKKYPSWAWLLFLLPTKLP